MRSVIVAAIALIVGFVVGSLGPRGELREAKATIAELQKKLEDKPKGMGLMGQLALGRMGRSAPERDDFFEDRPPPPPAPEVDVAPAEGAALDAPEALPPQAIEGEKVRDDLNKIGLDDPERLQQARTALEMRRAQARQALVERADLSEEEAVAFDEAVTQMNDELEVFVEDAAFFMKEDRQPTRREAMELASGVLDVLMNADDRFESAIGEDKYIAAGEEAVDPTLYLDPRLVDLFQEL